jgi:hypothetical protein
MTAAIGRVRQRFIISGRPIRADRPLKWERIHQPAGQNREDYKRTEKQHEVLDAIPRLVLGDERQNKRSQNAENKQ